MFLPGTSSFYYTMACSVHPNVPASSHLGASAHAAPLPDWSSLTESRLTAPLQSPMWLLQRPSKMMLCRPHSSQAFNHTTSPEIFLSVGDSHKAHTWQRSHIRIQSLKLLSKRQPKRKDLSKYFLKERGGRKQSPIASVYLKRHSSSLATGHERLLNHMTGGQNVKTQTALLRIAGHRPALGLVRNLTQRKTGHTTSSSGFCTWAYMWVYMHVLVGVHACARACTHTHTHTHMHRVAWIYQHVHLHMHTDRGIVLSNEN